MSSFYRDMPQSIDKIVEFAYNARADPAYFCKVACSNDTCHGFLVASAAPLGFHDATFVYDRMVYVTPNKRGSIIARMLIESLEEWANEIGASRIMLGITTGVRTKATERFYNKLGYATVGTLTMKEM